MLLDGLVCASAAVNCLFLFISLIRSEMDFLLPPTLPAGGIPWEKVLPPLIPRLSGTFGQYNWSPKLVIPEADNTSPAEVGYFIGLLIDGKQFIPCFGSTELH